MRILVSGDRNYTRGEIIYTLLAGVKDYWSGLAATDMDPEDELVLIEGEARGVDKMARAAGEKLGYEILPFPALWTEHDYEGSSGIKCYHKPSPGRCPAAGPRRNKQMLDEGKPDVVFCFHDDLENSKGTGNMADQAKKAGTPVYNIRRL